MSEKKYVMEGVLQKTETGNRGSAYYTDEEFNKIINDINFPTTLEHWTKEYEKHSNDNYGLVCLKEIIHIMIDDIIKKYCI